MDDEVVLGVIGEYPVQPPLQHRDRLRAGQWFEGLHAFEAEYHLGSDQSAQVAGAVHLYRKVAEGVVIGQRKVRIKRADAARYGVEIGADARHEATEADAQAARTAQVRAQFRWREG